MPTFTFEAICKLKLEHHKEMKTSRHVETKYFLNISDNLSRSHYLDKDDLLTAAGTEALTQVFIAGLVGNIHHAHKAGFRNDVEHVRYIISKISEGFALNAKTGISTYEEQSSP